MTLTRPELPLRCHSLPHCGGCLGLAVLFSFGAVVGRPGGRPRALTGTVLTVGAGTPKFRQSEAALKPRPRRHRNKGSPETMGFWRTFPRFSCVRKPGPSRGGETAPDPAGSMRIGAAHRFHHGYKQTPCQREAVGSPGPRMENPCRRAAAMVYYQGIQQKEDPRL